MTKQKSREELDALASKSLPTPEDILRVFQDVSPDETLADRAAARILAMFILATHRDYPRNDDVKRVCVNLAAGIAARMPDEELAVMGLVVRGLVELEIADRSMVTKRSAPKSRPRPAAPSASTTVFTPGLLRPKGKP